MKKQIGFTLIELMVAMTIGLIVVAATIAIYIATIRGSSDIVKSAQLNYDMDSALALMVNDIRRAGYWQNAAMSTAPNFFTQAATDLAILDTNTCVLYSYDANQNGVVDSPDEFFGFKHQGSNIMMRLSGENTTDCSSNKDNWQTMNITNGQSKISVDLLRFIPVLNCLRKRNGTNDVPWNEGCNGAGPQADVKSGDRFIETREVTIRISGHVDDATDDIVKDELTTNNVVEPYRVKVRNDRIVVIP